MAHTTLINISAVQISKNQDLRTYRIPFHTDRNLVFLGSIGKNVLLCMKLERHLVITDG